MTGWVQKMMQNKNYDRVSAENDVKQELWQGECRKWCKTRTMKGWVQKMMQNKNYDRVSSEIYVKQEPWQGNAENDVKQELWQDECRKWCKTRTMTGWVQKMM